MRTVTVAHVTLGAMRRGALSESIQDYLKSIYKLEAAHGRAHGGAGGQTVVDENDRLAGDVRRRPVGAILSLATFELLALHPRDAVDVLDAGGTTAADPLGERCLHEGIQVAVGGIGRRDRPGLAAAFLLERAARLRNPDFRWAQSGRPQRVAALPDSLAETGRQCRPPVDCMSQSCRIFGTVNRTALVAPYSIHTLRRRPLRAIG